MNNELLMKLDDLIEQLTINELILLNRLIIKRIKFIQKAERIKEMNKFIEGEHIYFEHNGKNISGRIVRFNPKTVSILTDNNDKWNIPPSFLRKVKKT